MTTCNSNVTHRQLWSCSSTQKKNCALLATCRWTENTKKTLNKTKNTKYLITTHYNKIIIWENNYYTVKCIMFRHSSTVEVHTDTLELEGRELIPPGPSSPIMSPHLNSLCGFSFKSALSVTLTCWIDLIKIQWLFSEISMKMQQNTFAKESEKHTNSLICPLIRIHTNMYWVLS